MPRRLAHFSDPRLDAQIGELIKKHRELQKDIEQLKRRLTPITLPDAMPPTEHEHDVADITDFPEAMPPTAHKASHAGGSDAITPADIGAETPSGAQAKVNLHAAELVTQAGGVHGLEIEEGTWTPVLIGHITAGTHTYSKQTGLYFKIDKLVIVQFIIGLTAKDANMEGAARISGVPFILREQDFGATFSRVGSIALSSGYTQIVGYGLPSGIQLQQFGNGKGSTYINATAIADNAEIQGSIVYYTA